MQLQHPVQTYMRNASLFLLSPVMAFAVLLGGCARNEARDDLETLVFSVDSTLLGGESLVLEDNGVAVGFPAGWLPLEASAVARLDSAAHVVIGADAPVQQCLSARTDSTGQSIFALTAIKTRDTAVVARLLDRYAAATAQGSEVRRTRFRTGDFIVSQLLVMNDDLVVFRMIYTSEGASAAVQLDWYVARTHYEALVHTIESVAGSVRRLPTNHTQGDAS